MKFQKSKRVRITGQTGLFSVCPEFPDYAISEDGRLYSHVLRREIKGRLGSDGRRLFTLKNAAGKSVHRMASSLVHIAFLGPIPSGYKINHIDHDHQNDRHSNLQLITQSNNMILSATKRRFKARAFNDDSVKMIRKVYRAGKATQTELAAQYGVNRRTIQKLVQKVTYQ